MKRYEAKLSFIGLAGPYTSYVDVMARNKKSALKKAERYIGDRTGEVLYVQEWSNDTHPNYNDDLSQSGR